MHNRVFLIYKQVGHHDKATVFAAIANRCCVFVAAKHRSRRDYDDLAEIAAHALRIVLDIEPEHGTITYRFFRHTSLAELLEYLGIDDGGSVAITMSDGETPDNPGEEFPF